VVVAGDHQRDVLRVEGSHLQDHRILAQVQQTDDVEGVVVGPRDLAHGVILQFRVRITAIPTALLERELVPPVSKPAVFMLSLLPGDIPVNCYKLFNSGNAVCGY